MRNHFLFRIFTALTVIALSFFSFVASVQAKGSATVGTTLTFEPPVPVSVGNRSIIVVHLISSKGTPVANQPVELFINGESLRKTRTDASGNASFRVQRDVAGTYALSATFKGSKLPSLGSSKASVELVVIPAVIEVHTTPSLSGVKFSLDDQIFASDAYGVARIEVKKAGKYHLKLLPLEIKDENIQMQFGRWGDDTFQPERDIVVPLDRPLEIGFEVSYQVSQNFVDLAHEQVDPARVTSITYKGSNGATFTFEDTETHWLPAGRIIRLNNGLQETKILYSVISIIIDGANVVSQAQQRFYVHPDDLWTIQLLLYSARFTARDALFGFPIGTGIHMEYPDGDVQSYSFETNEGYTLEGLARGIYRVTVVGAKGYAPPTPIALSRDQDVELMVFSYLDMGVFSAIGLFLSIGLLLFGRPYILTQVIGYGSRLLPGRRGTQPVLQPQFLKMLAALRSRLSFRRKTAGAETGADVRMLGEASPNAEEVGEGEGILLDDSIEQLNKVENLV